jgi:hypothetical protein
MKGKGMATKAEAAKYAREQFNNKLEQYIDDLDHTPFESLGGSLGEVELEDGRTAQIQFKITTDEGEWTDDAD